MMEYLTKINSGRAALRLRMFFVLFFALQCIICASPARSNPEDVEQGRFIVTGHILNKQVEVGVIEGFLERAVPFINSMQPEFVVLTGDVVLGGMHGRHRFPVETIKQQYCFFEEEVLRNIDTKVYCLAGNHDTGHVPHAPSVELFESLLNPLHFSFAANGSLFMFLSIYEPFNHVPLSKDIPPLKTVWESYDTPASRTLLDRLRRELHGAYHHIFVFTHASPCSDTPLGYYWDRFLIPLFSSLRQDVHVFSTDHFTRFPLYLDAGKVVQYKNMRFYNFAVFPRGIYNVQFDRGDVRVDLVEGYDFSPLILQEVEYQSATRWSMLWQQLIRRIGYPLRGKYNKLVNSLRRAGERIRRFLS